MTLLSSDHHIAILALLLVIVALGMAMEKRPRIGQFGVLFIILFLHISAILFYKYKKKRNLTKAMVTGNVDAMPASEVDGSISASHTYFGLFLMLVFIAAAQSITLLRPALF